MAGRDRLGSSKEAASVFTASVCRHSEPKGSLRSRASKHVASAAGRAKQADICDEHLASVWTPSVRQVEVVRGADEEVEDSLLPFTSAHQDSVPRPPSAKQLAYWGRAGFDPDRHVTQCKFCPFQSSASTHVKRYAALYNHYKAHHGGSCPSGVAFGARQVSSVQKLEGNSYVHWKCPKCDFGITTEVAMTKHNDTMTADKKSHWRACHSSVTWKAFLSLSHRARAVKGGVTRRNAETLKRIRADQGSELADFQLFLWPRANPTKTFKKRGGIRTAHGWACPKCGGAFRSPKDALGHRGKGLCCNVQARKKATRRIKALGVLRKQHDLRTPKDCSKAREIAVLNQADVIFNLPFSK